ncbi:expressed unknown protein [Seminavis robusta]|uniref:DUF6824 domain-containing protein n=1 Tax=Seminavis robusta TaxID=568900 RepID=A0A9N8ESV4_9STRA|nr:expressed unknown protein [Seminavis robusta]|eukprot:Sro1585_g284150.1 n/a (411) ;mRNA; r:22815-24047
MAHFPQFDPYYPPLQSPQQHFHPVRTVNGYWHPQLPRFPYPQPAMMPYYGPPPQQQYRPIQQPDNQQPHEQLYSPVKTTTTTADANNDDDIVFFLLPMDYRPCPNTVIIVGNHNNNNTQSQHAGNVRFQQLVQRELGAYRAAETENKTTVIRRVLTELQYAFVQQDVATCRWYRVPDAAQRDLVERVFQNAIKDDTDNSTLLHHVVQEQETGCVEEQEQQAETERGGGDETSTDTQAPNKSPSRMTTSTSSSAPVELTKKAPPAMKNMCDNTLATRAFTPLGGSQPTIITQDVPSTVTARSTNETITKAEDKAASAIISPEAPIVVIKNNPALTKAQRAIKNMCDGTSVSATTAETPRGRRTSKPVIHYTPEESYTVTASGTNEDNTKEKDKAESTITSQAPVVSRLTQL